MPGLTAPMQLYLYEYDTSGIRNLAGWAPTDEQWWVTGFNANHVGQADVTKQVVIASIDFSKFGDSDNNALYQNLKDNVNFDAEKKMYCFFDDANATLWMIWGEKSLWKN